MPAAVSFKRCAFTLATALAAALAAAPTAAAAIDETIHSPQAAERPCFDRVREDPATTHARVDSPGPAAISARLEDAGGSWELAVFEPGGRLVAASAHPGSDQVAQGFGTRAGELVVQACRIDGGDPGARLTVELVELTEPAPRMQVLRVSTPDEATEGRLTGLGLDLTEHGGEGFIDVVSRSPSDRTLLDEKGFDYEVVDPDLLATSLATHAAVRRAERRPLAGPALPSGRTGSYRRLADYSAELRQLAERHPRLVRYFTLPLSTYEGRPVEAIEVAPRVRRRDGRPVFLQMGAHHAREWPSAEHTIEFAYELLNRWKANRKPIRRLMRRTRVILIPVVNPDGFNISREAGEAGGAAAGRDAPGGEELVNLLIPYEYQRKNCRFLPPLEDQGGSCLQVPNLGLSQFGVDPNRNYGGFWGGPGASAPDSLPFGPTAQDYRGPGPFSEPETENVRRLVSRRQVVTLITNHTYSNLVLRPPGLQSQGAPPDEPVYKRLGDAMARENGYTSQRAYELYDTSGTTEDWSYYATGGFGFTFEIGPEAFHPSFDAAAAEYTGATEAAGDGGGNRAAYLAALRSTANRKRHALIRGRAPRGAILRLRKSFRTPSSPVRDGSGTEGEVIHQLDRLHTVLRVARSRRFAWHVNPSTRPLVDPRRDLPQPRPGEPSAAVEFSGNAATATPCADFDTENASCYNDHPFEVPAGPGIDNGKITVRIGWAEPVSDWDLKVFRDSDGDGSSAGETDLVGSSGSAPTTSEETTFAPPPGGGKYVARVINYAASSPYQGTVTFAKTESAGIRLRRERWTLTCQRRASGKVLARRKLHVARGGIARVDLRRACRR